MKASVVKIKGAGLKGLALAYFLKQRGIPSEIYELTDRAGGWIKTCHEKGFLFEAGPRGFRPHPFTLSLVDSLGLTSQLIKPDKAAQKRFIYYKGALRSLSYFTPQIAYGVIKDLLMPSTDKNLSIKDYFTKRMGKFCAETFVDAFASGVFGGDISQLSATQCFPQMTCKRSIVGSMFSQKSVSKEPLLSFDKGMQTLIEALSKDQIIHFGTTCRDADFDTTPNKKIPAVSLVAVNMGWKKEKLLTSGFGYLIPQNQKEPILGTVFDSLTFPDQNQHPDELRMTVMMGGAHHAHLIDLPECEIKKIALTSIQKHTGVMSCPDSLLIHKARSAIPQPLLNGIPVSVGINNVILDAYRLSKL